MHGDTHSTYRFRGNREPDAESGSEPDQHTESIGVTIVKLHAAATPRRQSQQDVDLRILAALQELIAGQRELVAQVRGLRQDLRPRDRVDLAARLAAHDVERVQLLTHRDELFVARIEQAFPAGENFVVHDLWDRPALRTLFDQHRVSPRQLGKWLQRVTGRACGPLAVERLGVDTRGAIWKIVRVLPTP
jgi:hypothetical protein